MLGIFQKRSTLKEVLAEMTSEFKGAKKAVVKDMNQFAKTGGVRGRWRKAKAVYGEFRTELDKELANIPKD